MTITNKIPILLILSLFTTAAVCGIFFFRAYRTAQKEITEYTGLRDKYTSVPGESAQDDSFAGDGDFPETSGLPYVAADFDSLLQINPDTVGWLAIPGTEISYPVLQAQNNSKYLDTSFSGERSGAGAIFLDCNNAANPLDKNSIVYGHNMGRGRTDMFAPLLSYNEKSYYDTHKWIQFDTIYKQYGWWRVFAVIHLDAGAGDFDYLKQNFADAAGFEAWIAQAKALSLYDTNVDVPAGAHILTLSTCNRADYGRNGRQLVMAVLVGRDHS